MDDVGRKLAYHSANMYLTKPKFAKLMSTICKRHVILGGFFTPICTLWWPAPFLLRLISHYHFMNANDIIIRQKTSCKRVQSNKNEGEKCKSQANNLQCVPFPTFTCKMVQIQLSLNLFVDSNRDVTQKHALPFSQFLSELSSISIYVNFFQPQKELELLHILHLKWHEFKCQLHLQPSYTKLSQKI